jgi:hypothetical protein
LIGKLVAELEFFHQGQELQMPSCIGGVGPDALAVLPIKVARIGNNKPIVEHLENGFRGPVVFKDYQALQAQILLKVKENAKVVQVTAQLKCLVFIIFQMATIKL